MTVKKEKASNKMPYQFSGLMRFARESLTLVANLLTVTNPDDELKNNATTTATFEKIVDMVTISKRFELIVCLNIRDRR